MGLVPLAKFDKDCSAIVIIMQYYKFVSPYIA